MFTQPDTASKERRRFLRFLLPAPPKHTVYVRIDQGLLLHARVIDASAAGIRLAHDTLHLLQRGSRIFVEEAAPRELAALARVQGVIRWVAPKTREFGVQFDRVLTALATSF
jgi:hypothetical protein